jgi:aldehyde dehydrogenase (NAD+)
MEILGGIIGGERLSGQESCDNINPSDTRDVVSRHARLDSSAVDEAVHQAKRAFGGWANASPEVRFDVLDKAGDLVLQRAAALGELLSREEGKTLPEGIGEAGRAGRILKFFAAECLRMGGEFHPSTRPGVDVEIRREAVGIVGLITPWNFPIAIPAWKLAPAIAFGNTVVIKPAEATPAMAVALVDILHEAGLPAGVVNLVLGSGSVVGEAIIAHPEIRTISFTGSVPTGRAIARKCAEQMKRVQLEMGGKNPLVVLDDADLDVAVNCAVNGAFFSTGQRCTASSRLIVAAGIHDAFVEKLAAATQALRVGNALDPQTQIGPVVDERQLGSNLAYVDIARSEGAEVIGGGVIEGETPGFYMAPALCIGTSQDQRINREEVFGPVASVVKVGDFEEAVHAANDTEFGLSSGICTTSLKHAREFKRRAEAGMVMVNLPTAGVDYHVPFGGRKASSHGPREQGSYAIEHYTTVKTAYTG